MTDLLVLWLRVHVAWAFVLVLSTWLFRHKNIDLARQVFAVDLMLLLFCGCVAQVLQWLRTPG